MKIPKQSHFRCIRCGYGSLVRSNFRFTPKHEPVCRAEQQCDARIIQHLIDSGMDVTVVDSNAIKARPKEGNT